MRDRKPDTMTPWLERAAVADRAQPMTERFVMTIEAVFTFKVGTIVTGTISDGIVRPGTGVEITGGGRVQAAVVRRVETFSKILTEAHAGERVSLVLDGVTSNNLATGYVIRGMVPSAAPVATASAVTPRGPDPRFGHAEQEYSRLRAAFDAGNITSAAFEDALAKMMFEYRGRYWMIGVNTGEWYASEGDQWIATTPPKQ